jgi:NAD(P)-dependent dehydrogenase (short-subunit alcohol dehydrogenase family)
MRVNGKVAVVTGAATGIGKATALRLAQEGAAVVVNTDRRIEQGEAVAGAIRDAGGQAVFVKADVSQASDVEQLMERAMAEFGALHVLVNNAVWNARVRATEMSEGQWDRTLAVSLKAMWLGAKYAIPLMKRSGGGAIVNISSVNSLVANPAFPAYAAAKAGVNGLTRQLALDYGRDGIRVNAIAVGFTVVERFEEFLGDPIEYRHALDCHPIGRLGRPEDMANAVLYLASDEASFVTGTTIVVDGGLTIQSPEALVRPLFRKLWRDDLLLFPDEIEEGPRRGT